MKKIQLLNVKKLSKKQSYSLKGGITDPMNNPNPGNKPGKKEPAGNASGSTGNTGSNASQGAAGSAV